MTNQTTTVVTDVTLDAIIADYLRINEALGQKAQALFAIDIMNRAFALDRTIRRKGAEPGDEEMREILFTEALEALKKTTVDIPLLQAVQARVAPDHVPGYDAKRGFVHNHACFAAWLLRERMRGLVNADNSAARDPKNLEKVNGITRMTVAALQERIRIRLDVLKNLRRALRHIETRQEWDDERYWLAWIKPDVRAEIRKEIKEQGYSPLFANILDCLNPRLSDDERRPLLNAWLGSGDLLNIAKKALAKLELDHNDEAKTCPCQQKEANS